MIFPWISQNFFLNKAPCFNFELLIFVRIRLEFTVLQFPVVEIDTVAVNKTALNGIRLTKSMPYNHPLRSRSFTNSLLFFAWFSSIHATLASFTS